MEKGAVMGGEPEPLVEVAKQEATRQLVILLFTLCGAGIMVWVMRKMDEPDFFITLKMRVALEWKHYCQERADMWQDRAGKAATWYQQIRP